jgi:acetophenone carboxylase
MENEFPLLIPLSQHWKDSCGHGKRRGGAGTVQMWVAHGTPQIFFMCISDNSKIQTPQPLFGGYAPATVPGISIRNPDLARRLREDPASIDLDFRSIIERHAIGGDWQIEFMGRSARPYADGEVITFGFSAGGAGYGDPLDSAPEGVVQDVVDEVISAETARDIYKVAFDPETLRVEHEETQRLRDEERRARLERGRSWDEFQAGWSQQRPPEEILQWFGSWPDGSPATPVVRM